MDPDSIQVPKSKGGVARTSASYESLGRVPRTRHSDENMPHVVVAKQSSRESCVNYVIRWRPLQTHTCFFTAMADSWSSSSEEHAILLGALAVLQHINDEEEEEKLKKRKRWMEKNGASSSAHSMLWWRTLKWRTPEHFQTLSGWMYRNFNIFFAVNCPQRHSHGPWATQYHLLNALL